MNFINQCTAAIVLAAGKGTRMGSSLPKVLHKIHDKSMIDHVTERLSQTTVGHITVVLSSEHGAFKDFLSKNKNFSACVQTRVNGTASAVACCLSLFSPGEDIDYAPGEVIQPHDLTHISHLLVCAGDTPAISPQTLDDFMSYSLTKNADISVLGMDTPDPTGYGRLLVNNQGELSGIVEEKDATDEQRKITLCNTGIIFAKRQFLFESLRGITNKNAQKEYYLTDCVASAYEQSKVVLAYQTKEWKSFMGVNTSQQLTRMDRYLSGK